MEQNNNHDQDQETANADEKNERQDSNKKNKRNKSNDDKSILIQIKSLFIKGKQIVVGSFHGMTPYEIIVKSLMETPSALRSRVRTWCALFVASIFLWFIILITDFNSTLAIAYLVIPLLLLIMSAYIVFLTGTDNYTIISGYCEDADTVSRLKVWQMGRIKNIYVKTDNGDTYCVNLRNDKIYGINAGVKVYIYIIGSPNILSGDNNIKELMSYTAIDFVKETS